MRVNLIKSIEKYSIEHTGKALANFVNYSKITNTKLGTYSSSRQGGMIDVVASGHQIFDMNDKSLKLAPSTVYTFTNKTALDKSPIFKNQLSISTSKLLKDYLDSVNMEEELKKELLDKLKSIDSRKALIIPLVIGHEFKVSCDNENKKEKVMGKLRDIKWATNKTNYKLECTVCFEARLNGDDKYIRLPITEYINSFMPDKLEFSKNITRLNTSILKFSTIGILNTIEITDEYQSIVIDNTYVYWLHNGITNIIGEWDYTTGDLLFNKETQKAISKSDVYKVFDNNISLIANHKHLIAPYNLYEINKINIKEKKK